MKKQETNLSEEIVRQYLDVTDNLIYAKTIKSRALAMQKLGAMLSESNEVVRLVMSACLWMRGGEALRKTKRDKLLFCKEFLQQIRKQLDLPDCGDDDISTPFPPQSDCGDDAPGAVVTGGSGIAPNLIDLSSQQTNSFVDSWLGKQ